MRSITNLEFKKRIKNIHPDLIILEEYKRYSEKILVQNKYGICSVLSEYLLNGHAPTIRTAVNKHEYFVNQICEKLPGIQILSKYENSKIKITVKDDFGICIVSSCNLLAGSIPSIRTAINKTEYFINQAKKVHGDIYDYSLVKYKDSDTPIEIICKDHGSFWQTPDNHLEPKGCKYCGKSKIWRHSDWKAKGLRSKNFDSFKCYVIKCWNDDKSEIFYKIGKTYRKINQRFKNKKTMPYNYEIIKIFEGDGIDISKLEYKLQLENKQFKYQPKINFNGSILECFFKIIIE